MPRAFILMSLCSLLVMASLIPSQPSSAQVTLTASQVVVQQATLPSSGDNKFPAVAGFGNVVYAASNPGNRAGYWEKRDSASAWPNRTTLGDAGGQADYSNANVTTGPDGSIYVVWIDRDSNRMNIRRKPPGAGFGARQTIGTASGFAVYLDVAVATDGTIFTVWNVEGRFRYSYSRNGGNTWTGRRTVSDTQAGGRPWIAAGANKVIIGHGGGGRIYASVWNGSSFDTNRVDRGSGFAADPSVTVAPNGNMYVAWRTVDDIFYVERQAADTSWRSPSRLVSGGENVGVPVISADPQNGLHLVWINNRSGRNDIYHTFKAPGANWESPIRYRPSGGTAFNVDGASTLSDRSYGHAVYEFFSGGVSTRYTSFASEGIVKANGQILIDDNAPFSLDTDVAIKINVTVGGANEYQISNDGVTFSDWAPIPANGLIPSWQLGGTQGTACEVRTVYGRLRNSARPELVSDVLSDDIQIDPGVDAYVAARNPYLASNPTVLSQGVLQDVLSEGPRDGDPRYTRVSGYLLLVQAPAGECSGLKQLQVEGQQPVGIVNNYYANINALPSFNPPLGENKLRFTVTDGAGLQRAYEETIYYDNTAPDVTPGTPEVLNEAGQAVNTTDFILVTLNFKNVRVTDTVYGQREETPIWGVWLANSRTDVPANQLGTLNWAAVPVNSATSAGNNTYTFAAKNWGLFSNLPADQRTAGKYYIYARILDGAGNASAQTMKFEVTLSDNFRLPEVFLPQAIR